jgi:hypothetical protein
MSREWLLTLEVGDTIITEREGMVEELVVSRAVVKTRNRYSVKIKRKHLKMELPMIEYDDDNVSYLWSMKTGNILNEFKRWTIRKNKDNYIENKEKYLS